MGSGSSIAITYNLLRSLRSSLLTVPEIYWGSSARVPFGGDIEREYDVDEAGALDLRKELRRLTRDLRTESSVEARRQTIRCLRELLDHPSISELGSGRGSECHPYRRRASAPDLGSSQGSWERREDLVGELISILAQGPAEVRASAADVLGMLGDDRAVPPLHDLLSHRDGALRRAAAVALAELGEPGWELLIEGDEKDLTRIGRSRDPRAGDVLRRALERGPAELRVHAIEGLEQHRMIEPLIEALADTDGYVRARAARALRYLASEARSAREHGDRKDRPAVLRKLVLGRRHRNARIRVEVVKVMGQLGASELVEPCIEALSDELPEVRATAAEALGHLGDRRAHLPLSRARVDGESEVWVRAREALRELGLQPDLEPLIEALGKDDWNVRLTAIDALAAERSPEAVTALGRAVHDSQPGVSAHALQRLLEKTDTETLAVLAAQMKVGQIAVRVSIARELAARSSPPALEALIEGVKGGTLAEASRLATEPLFPTGASWIVEELLQALSDGDARVRRFATQVLSEMGHAYPAPFMRALEAGDAGIRDIVVGLLDSRDDVETSKALVHLLASDDLDLRNRASRLLVKMGHRGVSALIAALSDDDDRIIVRSALLLAEVGDWRSVKALERAKNDPSPTVRGAAEAAFVSMRRRS